MSVTRDYVLKEYKVENGIIRSPGKFENCPIYAPYFYDMLMNGMADEDYGGEAYFDISDDEIEEYPELAGIKQIGLAEDDNGFIHITNARYVS